ncbi:MAG: hypothetical protein QHJ82_05385 [Verrucomicrobiota bacterium]|nr:hypothetical protein [Verrucomicrobiota bacterium]
MHMVSEDDPPEVLERGLHLGAVIWNLALVAEEEQPEGFAMICAALNCEKHPSVKDHIARMFLIRKLVYGHDRRMVYHFQLVKERDTVRLHVVSTDFGPEEEHECNT